MHALDRERVRLVSLLWCRGRDNGEKRPKRYRAISNSRAQMDAKMVRVSGMQGLREVGKAGRSAASDDETHAKHPANRLSRSRLW